jgi:hypothetical protein
MNMAMSGLKQRLLKIELAKLGFRDAQYSAEQDAVLVNPADERMIRITDCGEIFFYGEHDALLRQIIQPAVERINEMTAAWDKAPAAPLKDLSNFRILSEYNNVVLAARDDSERGYGDGLSFVTWRYDYDHAGVENGHYTTDYAAAKEDFALRCGLVDKNKMFDETEMKLIRQGL